MGFMIHAWQPSLDNVPSSTGCGADAFTGRDAGADRRQPVPMVGGPGTEAKAVLVGDSAVLCAGEDTRGYVVLLVLQSQLIRCGVGQP